MPALLKNHPTARGFTLIEMLIVVALIGVLAAVAFPSYQRHVLQSRRAAAQAFMTQIANMEEQYFSTTRAYTATVGSGGLGLSQPTETVGNYSFSVDITAPSGGYTITATRAGNQTKDTVGNLTLNSIGQKATSSGVDPNWR